MHAEECGARALLAGEAPCGEYAIATKPLWSALLIERRWMTAVVTRGGTRAWLSPLLLYWWRCHLREEGPNWAFARAEQAQSRTTSPLARTTAAPRASGRRDESSGLQRSRS